MNVFGGSACVCVCACMKERASGFGARSSMKARLKHCLSPVHIYSLVFSLTCVCVCMCYKVKVPCSIATGGCGLINNK